MPPDDARRPDAGAEPATIHAALSPAPEAFPEALDFTRFADTMSRLAATVCVATAASGDTRLGRTVTAVTSLSAEPPSLLVSITRGSDLAKMIVETGRFSLNLLAEGQNDVGDVFAGKRQVSDRFATGEWDRWASGQPRLLGAATAIECRVAGVVELETHCLFVGVLVDAVAGDGKPLLWYKRGYRVLSKER